MSSSIKTLNRLRIRQRILELLDHGLRCPIVAVETGQPVSSVRAIASHLEHYEPMAGPLPSPHYFVRNRIGVIEASMLMTLYYKMGGDEIFHSLDVDALIKAYERYFHLREGLPERLVNPFTIDQGWVLARALRSDEAWLYHCNCGCMYLVIALPPIEVGCPVCYKRVKRR